MLKEVENLIFYSRGDAEDVLSGLRDLVINHGKATIDDYYRLCGANSMRGNIDYGWTNLEDSIVTRRIGGYTIYLPTPVNLHNDDGADTDGDKKIELRFQRGQYLYAPNDMIEKAYIGTISQYIDLDGVQKKISSVKITENEIIVELI